MTPNGVDFSFSSMLSAKQVFPSIRSVAIRYIPCKYVQHLHQLGCEMCHRCSLMPE